MHTNRTRLGGSRFRRPALFLLLALLALAACQDKAERAHQMEVMDGRTAYERYCASCHGPDARGDGPVASVLNTSPPDLTQLKKKFDGVYPSEYVLRTVDGRHEFLAHGTRQMPIWGNIWREDSTMSGQGDTTAVGDEAEVQRRLNALLHYLETIQEEPE